MGNIKSNREAFVKFRFFFNTLRKLFVFGFFFQQGHIKLIKNDSKDTYNAKRYTFQINVVLLKFLFVGEFWKKCFTYIKQPNILTDVDVVTLMI